MWIPAAAAAEPGLDYAAAEQAARSLDGNDAALALVERLRGEVPGPEVTLGGVQGVLRGDEAAVVLQQPVPAPDGARAHPWAWVVTGQTVTRALTASAPDVEAGGDALGDALLGPVLDVVPPHVTHLLVVADEPARSVDLGALAVRGRRFGERFTWTLEPSVTQLLATRAVAPPEPGAVVVFGAGEDGVAAAWVEAFGGERREPTGDAVTTALGGGATLVVAPPGAVPEALPAIPGAVVVLPGAGGDERAPALLAAGARAVVTGGDEAAGRALAAAVRTGADVVTAARTAGGGLRLWGDARVLAAARPRTNPLWMWLAAGACALLGIGLRLRGR